ncbi:MAG: VCBS repeat-containing protein [Deltaproteobacteria bacterium]|nr:VCBS repeat-containing protein [Deltaproteobacteria bacterium]
MSGMRTIAAVLVAASVAQASASDWPMARHDVHRTGLAPGSSDIDVPAARWRTYLGGELAATAYVLHDVDGDGLQDAIFAAWGKVMARRANGIALWETPPLEIVRVAGLFDLDGDGSDELVALGARGRAYVLVAADGRVVWELPAGVLGEIEAARIADLDGDGVSDLYLAECRCCTFTTGAFGAAFSFARGFAAAEQLWEVGAAVGEGGCHSEGDTVGDFDGDGATELVYAGDTSFWAIDGAAGLPAYHSDEFCSGYGGAAPTDAADVDGDGRPELFTFGDGVASSTQGWRGAAMLDYDPPSGRMIARWIRQVDDLATDRHRAHGGSLADLDGDGTWEVVTSFFDGHAGSWRLEVLAAADGALRDAVAGQELAGVADVTGDGIPEFFGQAGSRLTAFHFQGGVIEELWTLDGAEPLDFLDRERLATRGAAWSTLILDLDGDGVGELLASSVAADPGEGQRILALQADAAPPLDLAAYEAPPGIRLTSPALSAGFTNHFEQLLMVRNDGYLVAFDDLLRLTNFSDDPEHPVASLRVGGYYSGEQGLGGTPIVVAPAPPGSGAAPIIVRDSAGALQRLDAAGASMVNPPAVVWTRSIGRYPSAVDLTGDGVPEVVHWTVTPTLPRFEAVEALSLDSGSPLWSTPMTDSGTLATRDLPFGDADGDGLPDVFVEVRSTGWVEQVNVLSGLDGSRLWATNFARPGGGWGALKAVDDVDADGRADIIGVIQGRLTALSGPTGSLIREVDYAGYYATMVADIDGDTRNEYFLHAGGPAPSPPRLVRRDDFGQTWQGEGGSYALAYGTTATCGSSARFVVGLSGSPELRTYDAATGAGLGGAWLAGGALYSSSEDMLAADATRGSLTPLTGVEDLTGAAQPAVLAGSTDGYLYAFAPCTSSLVWALNLGFPVGEPVVADTDGDGRNDILVSVADGYLYDVGRQRTPAPEYVWDTDPVHGFPDTDRDSIESLDTLYGVWAPVAGATSYEAGVLGPGDVFVTSPDFRDVGPVTGATFPGLDLRVGDVYRVAVRARGPLGPSPETLSDGIEVVDRASPTILLRAFPRVFSPDADGLADTVELTADMSDAVGLAEWNLRVLDADGVTTVRAFPARPLSRMSAVDSVVWDGRDDAGATVAEGGYVAEGVVRDLGGNSAIARVGLELDLGSGPDADAGGDVDGAGDGDDGRADAADGVDGEDGIPDAEVPDAGDDVQETATDDGRDLNWSPGSGGCACRAGGSPLRRIPAGVVLGALVLFVPALRRRPAARASRPSAPSNRHPAPDDLERLANPGRGRAPTQQEMR